MRMLLRRLVLFCLVMACPVAVVAQEELTITNIYSPPVTDLTMIPGGDLVLGPAGAEVLPSSGYSVNLGRLTRKYLTLHAAELWVETLVAHSTMATIGGRILVAPTTALTADLTTGATSIVVKHNNLASGDRVYMEANGQVEFMAIAGAPSGSGPYTYAVTRNLDGSGANAWTAGDAVLNTGQTGNGFIDLYSVRGVKAGTEIGPTVVFNQRGSSTYNDWSPRAAIGNLDGVFGYSGSTYGAAFGNPAGARVTIDATNGIRIWGGDNDQKVTIDTAGNATFDGDITVGTGRNQLRNSECRVSTEDWSFFTNSGLTTTLSFNLASFSLNNESNTCYLLVTGTPANNTVTQAFETFLHPVVAGQRYEASSYVNTFSTGNTHVDIQWLAADGTTQIGVALGNNCPPGGVAAGNLLSQYCRSGAIATAPAGTFLARTLISTTHNGSGANPSMFWVRAFFAQAKAQQEDLTEWGPAGITEITGGMIKTDAIVSRTIAADSITSAKIAAGTITASDIAANTITTGQIATNTIVAGNIATGTITADRMNITSLSAISGNMGTLTAGSITGGTIDGATIRGGTGDEITLDSSGITIAAGSGTNNRIKWSGVGDIWGVSGFLHFSTSISSTDTIQSTGGPGTYVQGYDIIPVNSFKQSSMPSSTGTAVIWETSCECLRRQSSSARYKENIRSWRIPHAQNLLALNPIRFDYRGDGVKDVVGLSAEDVYLVAPDAVNLDSAGRPDSIDQGALNAYLVQIVKELRAEIDQLRRERKQ